MNKFFLILNIIFGSFMHAQVGIGTVTPEAQLDIRASNQSTPANNDGILIPKIDEFPAIFPTVAQDGMMVFATGNGSVSKGFYYWDDAIADWTAIGAGGGGHDWNEVGTTTSPNSITDSIYTYGNVAIGKNTADYKLDIFENVADNAAYINLAGTSNNSVSGLTTEITNSGDGNQRGLNTILNSSGNGNHYGVLNQLSGMGTGTNYGVRNELTGTGTGDQEGMSTLISNTNNANHFGINTRLSGTGNGFHIGVRSNFTEGTGILTGNWTEFGGNIGSSSSNQIAAYNSYFAGGNGILAGAYTDIRSSVAGTGMQYGSYLTNSSAGGGMHFGARHILAGAGTGEQHGVFNTISNSGDATHLGIYNVLSGPGQGFQLGLYNIVNNTGNNSHYGLLNNMSGSGSGIHYGIRNELTGTGTGDQEGMSTLISNSSNSNHFGINTRLSGTGNGNHIGTLFSMSGTGSGFHTGVRTNFTEGTGYLTGNWTEFSGNVGSSSLNQLGAFNNYVAGGDGILAGAYTDIRNSVTGNGSQYGSFLTNSSPGSGNHYGASHTLSGTGTGLQYGVINVISNTGDAEHTGVRNELSGTATGNQYGVLNLHSVSSAAFQTGVRSIFSNGGGNLTGYWTEFNGSVGNGNQIGAYNNFFAGGNGLLAGVYTQIPMGVTGAGAQYGTYTTNSSIGGGLHYGNYNTLDGTGTGAKYGTYNIINSSAGGTHYGVYSDVQKAGSYAGYFLGNFGVDIPDNTFYINAATNRIGIGTITPATTAHIVQGTTNVTTGGLRLEQNGGGNYWTFFTAPTNNLWFAYNGALASFIQTNGTYSVSDKRLKNNIQQMNPIMDKVLKLNPVTYQYNNDEKHNQTIGFLAQEVEPLFPETVQFEPDYGYYGVKYDDFGVIAIKAIQEQQTEIELLKQQLAEQKAELVDLKNLIMGKQ